MIRRFFFLIIAMVIPVIVQAQTRISASVDQAYAFVSVGDFNPHFRWYAFSLEAEHEFKKDKLGISGFALGVRKEGKDIYDGTYITGRLFHAFDTQRFSLIVSGGFVYGLAGTQFDRTKLIYKDGQVAGYKNISMIRNIHVPTGAKIDKTGILQPVIDARIRKYMGRFFIEGRSGIRLARFSLTESDFKNGKYREQLTPMPSFSIGVGFSF